MGRKKGHRVPETNESALAAALAEPYPSEVPVGSPAAAAWDLARTTTVRRPAPPSSARFSLETLLEAAATGETRVETPYVVRRAPQPGPSYIHHLDPRLSAASTVPFGELDSRQGAERLRRCLKGLGFAVVSEVLTAEETAHAERLWAQDLRSIVGVESRSSRLGAVLEDPVHRWDPGALSLGKKGPSDFGLPHGRFAWFARAHPNVRACFATVFGDDELCVGLDSVFFQPGHTGLDDDDTPDALWPHSDANGHVYTHDGDVYQGLLYVWPSGPGASSTVVWPASHLEVYDHLMTYTDPTGGHFCRLDASEHADFVRHARRVPVPAGGLLLWNSKTIHQGRRRGPRLAQAVCYEPKRRRDSDALARKIEALRAGLPTTHSAALGRLHGIASGLSVGGDGHIQLNHAAHAHVFGNNKGRDLRHDLLALL